MAEKGKVEKVFAGCLDDLPDMELTSVLVFFSSTFTDMSVERNYLMKNAVPKLREYCFKRGLDFQIIDMRWGVRGEASVDHSTTDRVLDQVNYCQSFSKGPNFVAFIGDKYGSRLLPKHIDASEFKLLRRLAMRLKYDVTLLDKWYLRNENVTPTEFLLRPITDIYPDFDNDDPEKESLKQQAENDWNTTEEKLLKMLRAASEEAYSENLMSKHDRQKYFYSVTEAEIDKGILEYSLQKEKVLCYCRAFADINTEDKKAGRYVDLKDGKINDEAAELRERLKVTRLFPILSPNQLRKDHLYWTPEGVDINDEHHSQYLQNLLEDFQNKIIKMINNCYADSKMPKEVGNMKVFKDILHHLHFTKKKVQSFYGREELLEEIRSHMMIYHGEAIQNDKSAEDNLESSQNEPNNGKLGHIADDENYWKEQKMMKEHLKTLGVVYCHGDEDLDIESDPNRNVKEELIRMPDVKQYGRPIVLYGESGSGKTAVMAKVKTLVSEWFPGSTSIIRFFGTSPTASLIKGALLGMCMQIHYLYNIPTPTVDLGSDFDYLTKYFMALLWRINTASRPLIILLDSADQLWSNDYAHFMHWLPLKLPPTVHLLVSILPKVNGCLANMKQLMPFANQYIEVPDLPMNTADSMITARLHKENRRLTKIQRRYLLESFAGCSLPLYMSLLIDQSLAWTSSTVVTDLDLGKDINGAINKIFDVLERVHGSVVIARLCGYLGASKEGLTQSEYEDILSLDDEVLQDTYIYHLPPDPEHIRLPTSIRTQIEKDLNRYLTKQTSGGRDVINWFHRQFKLAAEERYLQNNIKPKLHESMAEYFMGTWHNRAKPLELYKRKKGSYPDNTRLVPSQPICFGQMGGIDKYNTRKMIELPYHLVNSKWYDKFRSEISCNFEFLLAKCQVFSVSEVIQDMRAAISEMDNDIASVDQKEVYDDIHIIYDCLRYGCNQLRRDPNLLASMLFTQLGPDYTGSSMMEKLISDATEWCKSTSVPLLVPVFRSLPPPGGILAGNIEVETFLRGENDRKFKDVMIVNMEKRHLTVIKPESRHEIDYLKVFDLSEEGNCIMTQPLKTKISSIKYMAQNRLIRMTDVKGVDVICDTSPENVVKLPHDEAVLIAVSDSGKYLVYSTGQGMIYICEIKNTTYEFIEMHTLSGYEGKLFDLMISPDDKMVVGSFKEFRIIWELQTGQELHKLDGGVGSTANARSLSYITRDNKLICGGKQNFFADTSESIQTFDMETGEKLYDVIHEGSYKYELSFLSVHSSEKYFACGPSGSVVVNGIQDKAWTMREIESGKLVSKGCKTPLCRPSFGVENLQFFGKDHIFVAVSVFSRRDEDSSITVGYLGTVSDPLPEAYSYRYLQGHNDKIISLLISPDETYLFSAAQDNIIKMWNLEKLIQEFEDECLDTTGTIDISKLEQCEGKLLQNAVTSTCMKINRDSQFCYIGTSDGNLIVLNLEDNREKLTIQLFDNEPVKHLLVSSNNKYVIAATLSGKISVWDAETGKISCELKHKSRINCLDEGNNILIVGTSGMEAKGCIWNIETGKQVAEPTLLYSFYAVAMNPPGTKFISSMFEFPIICGVDPNSQAESMMDMNKMDITSMSGASHVSFSKDGKLAAGGSADGSLRIITESGQYIFRMQQKSSLTCASFSVDGQYVVTGGYRSVYVWSIADGSLKYKLRNHSDFITNIKFDQSGRFMLTTGLDKKIVLWDFKRGFSLASFPAFCSLDTIDFSPNGQYIVYSAGNVGMLALLKPNPVLKQILEGNYKSVVSNSLQEAQAVALSFSGQKILQNTSNSHACEIM